MQAAGIHGIELIFLLLMILVVALAALAKRLETPYPIVMVIGGLIISFLPRVPKVALNPDIVFLVILPPLLFLPRTSRPGEPSVSTWSAS